MYLILVLICCAFLPFIVCNNCYLEGHTCRNTSQVCNKICEQGVCEIRAAVILPNDTNLAVSSLPQVRFFFFKYIHSLIICYQIASLVERYFCDYL